MRMIAALVLALSAAPSLAQERVEIGNGRLFANDFFGDGSDRWRTGSYSYSHIRAPRPYDGRGQGFGDIIEYRLEAEIIAPGIVNRLGRPDRPYVGALSLGVNTHFTKGPAEVSLGATATVIGPQTGLADLQEGFHDLFDLPAPQFAGELDNALRFSSRGEVSLPLRLQDGVTLRPFVSGAVGVEDYFRLGADVLIGPVAQDDLLLRDSVTGQLYRGTTGRGSGFTFVFGADIAAIGQSYLLPEDQGFAAEELRTRARAGVHAQLSRDVTLFYGATYLSEEFQGQPEGQVLGSLKLDFNF